MFTFLEKIFDGISWKLADNEKRIKILRKKGVNIGEKCEIYGDVSFGSEPYLIRVGNQVRISGGVRLITHDGGVWVLRNMGRLPDADIFGRITIKDNVNIGVGAVILPGITIGNNCIIGSGAVVTKDVPDNSIVAGVPARIIETIDEYYEKHKDTCDYTKIFSPEEKKEYLLQKYGVHMSAEV